MSNLIATLGTVGIMFVLGTVADAGHGDRSCCPCPCVASVHSDCTHDAVSPPAAPSVGQTEQSRSVQPQSAPPVAPRAGVTYRNYSIQPVPAQTYRAAPRRQGRQPYSPEQRLHPSNRLMGP